MHAYAHVFGRSQSDASRFQIGQYSKSGTTIKITLIYIGIQVIYKPIQNPADFEFPFSEFEIGQPNSKTVSIFICLNSYYNLSIILHILLIRAQKMYEILMKRTKKSPNISAHLFCGAINLFCHDAAKLNLWHDNHDFWLHLQREKNDIMDLVLHIIQMGCLHRRLYVTMRHNTRLFDNRCHNENGEF